jgi:hypothetical protein
VLVLGAFGAARAGLGGFRGAGGGADGVAGVAESGADAAGGHLLWRQGALPGQPGVGGQGPGEVELGVAGDEEPGPPVGGARVAEGGLVPAEGLLEEAEGVLKGIAGMLA